MINQNIFKSYDIRGIYPDELDKEAAFKIGRAFARQFSVKKAVIGQDARISSPELFLALARGILAEGADVYNIGQVPTECLYFTVGTYDFDAGIMITASHNPKEYNGFKIIKKAGNSIEIIRGKDLLAEVEKPDKSPKGHFDGPATISPLASLGGDFWNDYISHILSFVNLGEIKPFKVVVDASNGVAGIVLEKIKDKLPVEIISLNFEPNGNFPNHSPNPLAEGSADQIKNEIKKQKADFGLIFDGDADRIFLADENGELVRADATLLLLAKYFLEKNPGTAIAYNAICSKAVPEFIKKWGGKPVRTQVGFINVREGLLKNNGAMGGELSGHYCFKDNFYMDSGMIAFLVLLQIISKDPSTPFGTAQGKSSGQVKVSEIITEFSPYAKSPELNFQVENKEAIMEKVKEKYSDGKQDFLDGVTVEYENWWFNIRPSNTEPLLRLTIEADTQDILEKKIKELTEIITE
ncbi:MAG: phosphomannomutase/phosphoglucomutase [Patescibacteria group bacterium]